MILHDWEGKLPRMNEISQVSRCLLLFVILLSGNWAETFIEGAARYASRSGDFQRIYVKRELKRVRLNYLAWIQNCSDKQLIEHLAISYFGSKLYSSLKGHIQNGAQLPNSPWIKQNFYKIVYHELAKIEKFLDHYFESEQFDVFFVELTKVFLSRYEKAIKSYASHKISSDEFQAIEKRIGTDLLDADLNNETKELIRICLFLQLQSKVPRSWR